MEQIEMINTMELDTSSSAASETNRMEIMHEDKDGPVEKKLKMETKDVNDGQFEVEKSFDDLPPEMLMKILKKLDDKHLFRYRLVNRQWNGVASEILQSNASVELQFECYNVKNEMRIKGKNKMSFKMLIKYFEDSPNFPYSRLRFDQVQREMFTHRDWIKLVSNHGDRIKCLILGIKGILEGDIIQMSKDLQKLLFNQLPNLQQLGIEFSDQFSSSKIKLFSTTSNSEAARLPHLKILHIYESSFTRQSGIVTDLLHAAVNLRKIELCRAWLNGERSKSHASIKEFHFLHSLGKLDLLKCASIDLTLELLSTVKEKCKTPLVFKLKELELHWSLYYINKDVFPEATIFLSNLFESSKDTLTKLSMPSLGFLTELQVPTFSKLTSLNINSARHEKFLPDGLSLKEIFPVLNSLELKIPWATAFSNFDNMDALPFLETLRFSSVWMNSNSAVQINSMCPNLKNFEILSGGLDNFPEVSEAIWTHLTKLHSLELDINVDCSNIDDQAVDSCITGISKEECRRLYHLVKAEEHLELSGCKWKIPDSEWKYEQENVSILNLKDLKSFTVHLISKSSKKAKLDLAMTFISENYALKLMDNLTYKIKKK